MFSIFTELSDMHVCSIMSKYQALSNLSWRMNATLRQTHLDAQDCPPACFPMKLQHL